MCVSVLWRHCDGVGNDMGFWTLERTRVCLCVGVWVCVFVGARLAITSTVIIVCVRVCVSVCECLCVGYCIMRTGVPANGNDRIVGMI